MSRVHHVVVALPVRDEEELLPACLASLAAAAARVREATARTRGVAVRVDVVVALDRCTDGSAVVAARHRVRVVELAAGSVGAARRLAAATGLAAVTARGGSPSSTWLCSTDADTVVPPHWLVRQLEAAEGGADLVLGTVEPHDLPAPLHRAWWRRHHLAEGHPHVHAANLGVRADAYLAVGGFEDLPEHEDVDLVDRLRRSGAAVVATDRTRVRTSGRLRGRTPHGFAGYLAALGGAAEPVPGPQNTGFPPVTPRTVPET